MRTLETATATRRPLAFARRRILDFLGRHDVLEETGFLGVGPGAHQRVANLAPGRNAAALGPLNQGVLIDRAVFLFFRRADQIFHASGHRSDPLQQCP